MYVVRDGGVWKRHCDLGRASHHYAGLTRQTDRCRNTCCSTVLRVGLDEGGGLGRAEVDVDEVKDEVGRGSVQAVFMLGNSARV